MENNAEYFKSKLLTILKGCEGNDTYIVSLRCKTFQNIYNFFIENGFPKALSKKECSIILFYFQEAIYDGIDWWEQNADLGHLETSFELDCMFQNGGKKRNELTQDEFRNYVEYSRFIIDSLKQNKNNSLLKKITNFFKF